MKHFRIAAIIAVFLLALAGFSFAEDAKTDAPEAAPAAAEEAAAPASETAAEPAISAAFTVERMVLTEGIENREPTGEVASFPATTAKAYVFLEAKDIAEDTPVSFVWSYKGNQVAKVDMTLGKSSRWRTYSSKNVGGFPGDWKVALQDADGLVVKEIGFTVEQ